MFDFFKRKKTRLSENKASAPKFSIEQISGFEPFNELNEKYCILAHDFIELVSFPNKHIFIQLGESDEFDYFLLDGEVSLKASDGKVISITHQVDRAKKAIAILRPRRFSCRVESEQVHLLKIPHHILSIVIDTVKHFHDDKSRTEMFDTKSQENALFRRIEQEIDHESLLLPSWPEVALRVSNACEDENVDLKRIAEIAASDVSIATKLLKAANSAFYRGAQPANSLHQAVSRLGHYTTKHLVNYYAAKELFSSNNPDIQKEYQRIFDESLYVAVLAKVLVKEQAPELSQDVAFLSGLLHKVGYLPVFTYAAEYLDDNVSSEHLLEIARQHNSEIASKICHSWRLDPVYEQTLSKSLEWDYQAEGDQVDYAEVVIAARVHYAIKHEQLNRLPKFTEIPALKKLFGDGFGPERSIAILLACEKELALYQEQ